MSPNMEYKVGHKNSSRAAQKIRNAVHILNPRIMCYSTLAQNIIIRNAVHMVNPRIMCYSTLAQNIIKVNDTRMIVVEKMYKIYEKRHSPLNLTPIVIAPSVLSHCPPPHDVVPEN